MYGTVWSLLPLLIAIVMAMITKEVYSSMLIGILVGALCATGFSPVGTLNMVVVDGFSASVSALAGNFCFLVFLGALIHLMERSGGSKAFGNRATRSIRSREGVQAVTFGLGLMIFIDDYFNCLTVGSVMRPATDKQRISRAKLAYLVDATAAPVCMIAPISSWAAAVASVANDLGTGITGTQLFIRTMLSTFYPPDPIKIGAHQIVYALKVLGCAPESEAMQAGYKVLDRHRLENGRYILTGSKSVPAFKAGNAGEENKWVTLYACMAHA